MRTFAIVVSLACLSSPAFAQNQCAGGVAKKEFVVPFNAAGEAITHQDYSGALRFAATARPHAISQLQSTALNQIEIAALAEIDLPAAKLRMNAALSDNCLPPEVRQQYVQKLAE